MIDSLLKVLTPYAEWYAAPIFIITVLYIIIVIGWFFSTDYYDSFSSSFNGDEAGFHLFIIIAIACSFAVNILCGMSSGYSVIVNTFLWVFFILPAAVALIDEARTSIRRKRGK